MVRVQEHRAVSAGPGALRHKQLMNGSKPSYKVVLEQVTQQKKKLNTVDYSNVRPPSGYTFIAAGDPQFTDKCKYFARLDGAKVFVVSTSQARSGLSRQVHRIGYHFPSSIVGRACMSLGIDLSRSGHVLRQHESWPDEQPYVKGRRVTSTGKGPLDLNISQASLDAQAEKAIKDLFPKIPTTDLHQVIHNAFELGQGKVGTAADLTLPRRVQLAVVAHIRHTYTNYDNLLRQVTWHNARALVENATLSKFAEWRGDDDDEPNAMEEILREVIVIPDDEDEDERAGREGSVEFISTRAIAANQLDSPASEDEAEVTFLGHGQYAIYKRDPARSDKDGAHRKLVWEQARGRVRPLLENPSDSPIRLTPRVQPGDAAMKQLHKPQRAQQGYYQDPRSYSGNVSIPIRATTAMPSRESWPLSPQLPTGHEYRERLGSGSYARAEAPFAPLPPTKLQYTKGPQYIESGTGSYSPHKVQENVRPYPPATNDRSATALRHHNSEFSGTRSHSMAPQLHEKILPSIEFSPRAPKVQSVQLSRTQSDHAVASPRRHEPTVLQNPFYREVQSNTMQEHHSGKRRRLDTMDSPINNRQEGEEDLRRSLLIPVASYDDHGREPQTMHLSRHDGDKKPLTESSVLYHHRSSQLDGKVQKEAIPLHLSSQAYAANSTRNDLSQHTQIFLSPVHSQGHVYDSPTGLEQVSYRNSHTFGNSSVPSVANGTSPPYFSLQENGKFANGLAHRESTQMAIHPRLRRAPHAPSGEESYRGPDPHHPSQDQYSHGEHLRPLMHVPLEKSFQELRTVDQPPRIPIDQISSHDRRPPLPKISSVSRPIYEYEPDVPKWNEEAMTPINHRDSQISRHGERRFFEVPRQRDPQYRQPALIGEKRGQQEIEGYRSLVQVNPQNGGPVRLFDSQTGREVVLSE